MREYKSFGAVANALKRDLAEMDAALGVAMEVSAIAVLGTVREELGTYQRENMGDAAPWAELKDETKIARLREGYSENDPEFRSGQLWASIEYRAEPREFYVWSTDPVAVYQELGTPTIPPRAFFAPALHRNIPSILRFVGEAIEESLSGTK